MIQNNQDNPFLKNKGTVLPSGKGLQVSGVGLSKGNQNILGIKTYDSHSCWKNFHKVIHVDKKLS